MTTRLTPPWHAHYEPGVPLDLAPDDLCFDDLLEAAAADAPQRPALAVFNRVVRYAELDTQVARVAAALRRDGLASGDRVLVALPDSLHAVVAALGTLRAGGAVVPLHPALGGQAAHDIARQVGPGWAIVVPELAGALVDVVQRPDRIVVARVEDAMPASLRWLGRLVRGGPENRATGTAVAWSTWLHATGGSLSAAGTREAVALVTASGTARAAGDALRHRHLVAGARQLGHWMTDAQAGDTILLLAPVDEPLGFVTALGVAPLLGARLALLPAWDPEDVGNALRFLRPTHVVAGAPAVAQLVSTPMLARFDVRSVRAWITDDPLDPETVRAFESATGLDLCLGFGPRGVGGLATCNPVNGRRALGSAGIPLPGVSLRVVANDGRPLPPESPGTIEVRGPNVPGDRWLTTGRTGHVDADGFVYLEVRD